jgi:hypothetical protein
MNIGDPFKRTVPVNLSTYFFSLLSLPKHFLKSIPVCIILRSVSICFTGTLKTSIRVCKYFLKFFWITGTLFQKCSGVHCLTAHGLFDESDLATFLLICIRKLQILVQMCYIHTPLVQLFNMAYQLYNTGYFQHLCFWNKDLLMQKYTTYSEFELYGYKPEHFL